MITLSARALASRLGEWRDGGPAYRSLADRIRLQILDGRIPVGARLPAERELAAALGLSRTTVAAAYAVLRDRGAIESLRGSGSVARLPLSAIPEFDPTTSLLDLGHASLPPIPQLAAAAAAAAARLPAFLGGHGFDLLGAPSVRRAIADRYVARGLPTEPEQIMITLGAQHAMSLLFRVLLQRGDRVLIENPTYPHAMDAVTAAGGRLIPVPVDAVAGWDESAIAQSIARGAPAAAYLMPDNHNPTGASMPTPVLERTLATAAAHGTVVVVDETMAELTLDAAVRAPAATFGPAVLIGSVGKTVWGGVRIGWIRAEPSLIQSLVRARSAGDLGTPLLEQLVVAELLPDFETILAQRRDVLRAGRAHVLGELARRFPEWTVPTPAGGLTIWAGLGRPASSALTIAARAGGLAIAAGPRFAVDGAFERFIRIPFSHPQPETDRALDVLERAWAGLPAGVGPAPMSELAAVV